MRSGGQVSRSENTINKETIDTEFSNTVQFVGTQVSKSDQEQRL